jgi:DNA invertase Pin-like site-specific DNA recombinase
MHHGTLSKRGQDAARAEGRRPGRRRKVTPAKLRMAMGSLQMPNVRASEVATMLGINRTVLYRYVNGDGSLKPLGQALLSGTATPPALGMDAAAD